MPKLSVEHSRGELLATTYAQMQSSSYELSTYINVYIYIYIYIRMKFPRLRLEGKISEWCQPGFNPILKHLAYLATLRCFDLTKHCIDDNIYIYEDHY